MSLFRRIPTSSVADLTALAAEPVGARKDGFLIYVKSKRAYFQLERVSVMTPNGSTCIAGRGLSGSAWTQVAGAHPAWSLYSDWYIDATIGNDENDGTQATQGAGKIGPIKTLAELWRRWGDNPLTPPVNVGTRRCCFVRLVTTIPDADPLFGQPVVPDNTYIIVVGGVLSTVFTGTITAITAKDPTTDTPWAITDSALPANNTWTSALGVRVRLTSGTNINATAYPMKDLGTKNARITDFFLNANVDPAATATWITQSIYQISRQRTPTVGDAYAVEQLKALNVGAFRPRFTGSTTLNQKLVFVDCQITSFCPDIQMSQGLSNIGFQGCVFSAFMRLSDFAACGYMNCCLRGGASIFGGTHQFSGGLIGPTANNLGLFNNSRDALVSLDSDVMFQGGGVRGTAYLSNVAVFDCPTSGTFPFGDGIFAGAAVNGAQQVHVITIGNGVNGSTIRVWGSGNARGGIGVGVGSAVIYKSGIDLTKITIVGSAPGTNDLVLNGNTTGRAWDESAGAFTTARTLSWTNVRATIATGGFGGNAQDVASGARFAAAA